MRQIATADQISSNYTARSRIMVKKTVFGKEVDLSVYEQKWNPEDPKVQEWVKEKYGGELIKFLFVDLNHKNQNDPEFTNVGVRDEQNTGTSIDDMRCSYQEDGWTTDDFPPIVDEEVDFDDGRTRALAAMDEMERYIPAAMIRKPDNSLKSKLTTGLLSNYFAPRRRVVAGDYIVAGATAVSEGEIKRSEPAIKDWLYKDLKIEKIYPSNSGGTITKIVTAIMNRTESGAATLLRKLDNEKWLDWLAKSPDMKDASGNRIDPRIQLDFQPDFVLYNAPSTTNEARLLYKILENASRHNPRHTYIVLYTNKDTNAETIRIDFKDFAKRTETSHSNIIRYTQNSVNITGIDVTQMKNSKPFTFLGAVPCLMDGNGHELAFKGYRLLPLNQF